MRYSDNGDLAIGRIDNNTFQRGKILILISTNLMHIKWRHVIRQTIENNRGLQV